MKGSKKPKGRILAKKWPYVIGSFFVGMVTSYVLAVFGVVPSTVGFGPFAFDLPLVSRLQFQELEAENSYLLGIIETINVPTPELETHLEVADKVALHGNILFQDIFDNNRNNWDLTFQETALVRWSKEINDGGLRLDLIFNANASAGIKIPMQDIKNFVLSVDSTIKDASLNDPTIVEIKFRIDQDGNYYSVRFSNNGTYAVRRCEAREGGCSWHDILAFVPAETIQTAMQRTDSFAIVVLGSTISIYSNNERLATIQDSTLTEPGGLSLGVWGEQGNTAIVDFDNLIVSDTSKVEGE